MMRNRRLGLVKAVHSPRAWAVLAAWAALVLLIRASWWGAGEAYAAPIALGMIAEVVALVAALVAGPAPRRVPRAEVVVPVRPRETIAPPPASEDQRTAA